jgi:hypothetical protein
VGASERVQIGFGFAPRVHRIDRGQLAISSGIKRCAFSRQCVIAQLHVGDRSRDDWTEIQESDEKVRLSTFMQRLRDAAVAAVQLPEDLCLVVCGDGAGSDGRYVAS